MILQAQEKKGQTWKGVRTGRDGICTPCIFPRLAFSMRSLVPSDRADFTVCGDLAKDYAVPVTVRLLRFGLLGSKTLWSLIAATNFGPNAIDLIDRRMFSVDVIGRRSLTLRSFVL